MSQTLMYSRTLGDLAKRHIQAGHWWLKPVILATWEAEIRRIKVQGQPGQIVHKIPSPKIIRKKKTDWRCYSSGRVPTLQVQSYEFKPQSYQKKKKAYSNTGLELCSRVCILTRHHC
jgi:DNA-directed RNA polymerase subunit N (RpoN/RPB10)